MDNTFISLFGGIGGFDLALINNGWECVGYYDIDKYATQVYNYNFKTNYLPTDITTVKEQDVPMCDMIVGGPPCVDVSLAGLRQGLHHKDGSLTRSGLVYHYIRIAKALKPKYLLLENVKGLLSSINKETNEHNFDNILECLCELGYAVDFTILNSKDFGVPQNRERVFILAIRKDLLKESELI